MSSVKETKFFVLEREHRRSCAFYEARYFSHWRGERAVGEADPEIIDAEEAPRRIRDTLGEDVRLVFCFRHPVDRAYSHYLHNYARLAEFESFESALKRDCERDPMPFRYRRTGDYARDLGRFLACFPRDNCLTLVFEELYGRNGDPVIRSLLEFLGVASDTIAMPHAKQRFLPCVRMAQEAETVQAGSMVDRDAGPLEEARAEPGDIVLGTPDLGVELIRRPSRQTSELLARHMRNRPPLTLPPDERERLYRTYFASFVPPLEEIMQRSLDLWRM